MRRRSVKSGKSLNYSTLSGERVARVRRTTQSSPKSGGGATGGTNRKLEALSVKIEDEPFFHGFCTHSYSDERLIKIGDWLVRATEARQKTEIIISIRSERKVNNYSIAYNRHSDCWYLGILKDRKPFFRSMVELIKYYQRHKLPGIKTHLKRAVLRPKWNISHDTIHYDKQKDFLGEGNFASVYKGKLKSDAKDITVAIKVCHQQSDHNASQAKRKMFNEGFIMSFYDHENVVKFYGMILTRPPIVIVLEFCPGGALLDHLVKQKDQISLGERVLYCYEAAKGMNYLHTRHTIHRDLAARNCLISADGVVKIADFGLSMVGQRLSADNTDVTNRPIPLRWMAPETLVRHPKFSTKSDVWSFGILMYEIFNLGVRPWPDEENKKVATMIRKGQMIEMPGITPPEIKDIVLSTWKLEPEERPSFRDMLPDLFDLHNKKIKPPEPALCTVNKLNSVKRKDFDKKLDLEADVEILDLLTNQQTTNEKSYEEVTSSSTPMARGGKSRTSPGDVESDSKNSKSTRNR